MSGEKKDFFGGLSLDDLGKEEKDAKKNEFLKKEGVFVLRLRGGKLKKVSRYDIPYIHEKSEKDFSIIKKILMVFLLKIRVKPLLARRIKKYLAGDKFANEMVFKDLLAFIHDPRKGQSLGERYPIIAEDWHPTKNGKLTPFDVSYGSGKMIWWRCQKGHEWQAPVNAQSEVNGKHKGCSYCANRMLHLNNSLEIVNPKLAREWHPTRNGSLNPTQVVYGSAKKVWWKCSKGHEWQAVITNRHRGAGCMRCYRSR